MTNNQLIKNYRELGYSQVKDIKPDEKADAVMKKSHPSGSYIFQIIKDGKTVKTLTKER